MQINQKTQGGGKRKIFNLLIQTPKVSYSIINGFSSLKKSIEIKTPKINYRTKKRHTYYLKLEFKLLK